MFGSSKINGMNKKIKKLLHFNSMPPKMMMFEHKLLRKSNLDLYSYLKKIFIDLGIKKGDIVYVASDILKLIILCKHKKIKFDQGIIVNCLRYYWKQWNLTFSNL